MPWSAGSTSRLGPTGEPDQGWCGAAFGYDIEEGSSDGVDLGGCQVALAFEWPGNFFGGNGSGRLDVDEAASAEQRRELEAIFVGKKGGPLAAVWDAVITKWLLTQATRIDIQWGEKPSLRVGDVGQATLSPLRGPVRTADPSQGRCSTGGSRNRADGPCRRGWELLVRSRAARF